MSQVSFLIFPKKLQPFTHHHKGISEQILPIPLVNFKPIRVFYWQTNTPYFVANCTFSQNTIFRCFKLFLQVLILRKLYKQYLKNNNLTNAVPVAFVIICNKPAKSFNLGDIIRYKYFICRVFIIKADGFLYIIYYSIEEKFTLFTVNLLGYQLLKYPFSSSGLWKQTIFIVLHRLFNS